MSDSRTTSSPTFADVNRDVLRTLNPPGNLYFAWMCVVALGLAGFFLVGLVPDIAALRDASTGWRRRIFSMLALGWEGSDTQWRHYRRAYGLLASLATPLVLSVHSVVSWDFAMALVPGWHSTLFAPFFVDGAIFSGFAMVLVLIIPMRHFFRLQPYLTDRHLDAMAKLILVTSLVLTYFYVC